MSTPVTEQIARRGRGTWPEGFGGPGDVERRPAAWPEVEALLRAGSGTTWLSVPSATGVHTRPVFAAWTGTSFVLVSNPAAAKTRRLEEADSLSLAVDLSSMHLVVEGTATRLTGAADLERAVAAMDEVYGWPTTVAGDQLDAPYAAPTSGGPPLNAYEITPVRAFAFPTADQMEPTRFTW